MWALTRSIKRTPQQHDQCSRGDDELGTNCPQIFDWKGKATHRSVLRTLVDLVAVGELLSKEIFQ